MTLDEQLEIAQAEVIELGRVHAEQAEWEREHCPTTHEEYMRSPFAQWSGKRQMELLRQEFEDGDATALMSAIKICAQHGLTMPEWVATNYIERFGKVRNFLCKSWDEAFGAPFRKGIHLAAMRKRREIMFQVYRAIIETKNTPIDEYLFEQVGKRFSIGKTLAAELYYKAKRINEVCQTVGEGSSKETSVNY